MVALDMLKDFDRVWQRHCFSNLLPLLCALISIALSNYSIVALV